MKNLSIFLALVVLSVVSVKADSFNLGTAGSYAVLGGAGVANTGNSIITGSVAGSIGTPAVTGFTFSTSPGPGTVLTPGVGYTTGASALVFDDATAAYNAAAGQAVTETLTGQDLGGLTLMPGVYFFGSTAQLTGALTLNEDGENNVDFVFQIGTTLITASDSSVVIINPGDDDSVYWQVGTSATLGGPSSFYGNILAEKSITLDTGANIACGSAIGLGAAVTLNDNNVSIGNCAAPASSNSVPEPGTLSLLALGFSGIAFLRGKRLRVRYRKMAPAGE